MPSGLIATNPLVGPFTCAATPPSGSSAPLGLIGPEGIRFSKSVSGEPITSDQYGKDTILDAVYSGGNLYLEFTLLEANLAAVKNLAHPFSGAPSSTTTALFGQEHELGNPGSLWSAGCSSLVITPVAGTLAYAETTPVRTFSLCALAMGHTLDMFLKSGTIKTLPIRMVAFPFSDGGSPAKMVFFTRSAHG